MIIRVKLSPSNHRHIWCLQTQSVEGTWCCHRSHLSSPQYLRQIWKHPKVTCCSAYIDPDTQLPALTGQLTTNRNQDSWVDLGGGWEWDAWGSSGSLSFLSSKLSTLRAAQTIEPLSRQNVYSTHIEASYQESRWCPETLRKVGWVTWRGNERGTALLPGRAQKSLDNESFSESNQT